MTRSMLFTLAGLLLALPAEAQNKADLPEKERTHGTQSGTVQGEVFGKTPQGEYFAVPGAKVILAPVPGTPAFRPLLSASRESVADSQGRFVFEDLPTGAYRVSATAPGLSGERDEMCLLAPGGLIRLKLEMRLVTLEEFVEVDARAQRIDPEETSATGTIGGSTLEDVPTVRERLEDLLPLLPGVIRGPDGRINLKGTRNAQSGALVNSANVTDPVTGGTAINLPIDVVSNVKVLSNPFDAQYGKFTGALSTVQTNVSDLDSFRFRIQNFLPRPRRRDGHYVGIGKAAPRLTLSSPVIPGRMALTQSFEYRYIRTEIENAELPQLKRDTVLESFDSLTQFDVQLNDRHTLSVNLSLYPQKQDFFGLNTFTPQSSTPNLRQRGYLVLLRDTHAFRSGALLQSGLNLKTFDGDVKSNSLNDYRLGIETTGGGFFNLQERESTRYEWNEIYHLAPVQAGGSHQFKLGLAVERNRYQGRQAFRTVEVLGMSDRVVERMDFTQPTRLEASKNEYALFGHDHWKLMRRLTLDLGLRLDLDSASDQTNLAPRVGFAYLLTNDNRTVVRGGIGTFYGRLNLNLLTFPDLPTRTVTRFPTSGGLPQIGVYSHRLVEKLKNPRSVAWSLQLDREVFQNFYARIGLQERHTTRTFLVNPETTEAGSFLVLRNDGRDRYREFEITGKYQLRRSSQLTSSYVYSSAIGDLNDFNQFFGNVPQAVIRPNQRSRLPFDVRHRFLLWAELTGPYQTTISPVWDIHSGFPYSIVDESRDFVGRRNRERFPWFSSFDIQALKQFELPFWDGKYRARIGVRLLNLLDRFNPQDVQNNLSSPRFGDFFNSKDRSISAKLILDF